MINNMLKSILCLSLLAIPLLAQPGGFKSLAKRDHTLHLEIYLKDTEFPNDEDLKAINCTTAYPVGANPVTLELSSDSSGYYGATFGDGLDIRTLNNKVYAPLLASVPLRADESIRTFRTQGLGKGKDLNCEITLEQETEYNRVAWIYDRGLELFFDADGKRDWAPGSDVLNITCTVIK